MKLKPVTVNWTMIGMMIIVTSTAQVRKIPFRSVSGKTESTATISVNPIQCDLTGYKEVPGLKAEMLGNTLRISWRGTRGQELRASFGLIDAAPIIREIAIRRQPSGQWSVLGRDLSPEFHVTTGRRRISEQQLAPLRTLGLDHNSPFIESEKWKVFWDAPLVIPGSSGTNPGLPRSPEEIQRAS